MNKMDSKKYIPTKLKKSKGDDMRRELLKQKLREAIDDKKSERVKGSEKEKINYDD